MGKKTGQVLPRQKNNMKINQNEYTDMREKLFRDPKPKTVWIKSLQGLRKSTGYIFKSGQKTG